MTFGPWLGSHDSDTKEKHRRQDEINKEIARFYKRKIRYNYLSALQKELNKIWKKHDNCK